MKNYAPITEPEDITTKSYVDKGLENKLDKTGGTVTGSVTATQNLSANYIIGNWLQTKTISNLGKACDYIAVIRDDGWVYVRTPAEILGDIGGFPKTGGTVNGQVDATWLKSRSVTDLGSSALRIAVFGTDNYIYTRTPSELLADIGALPSTTKIPSKTSDLTNDSDYTTKKYVDDMIGAINTALATLTVPINER